MVAQFSGMRDSSAAPLVWRQQEITVHVLCFQFSDLVGQYGRTCPSWVAELNGRVRPWWLEHSYGRYRLNFVGVPYRAGAPLTPQSFFVLNRPHDCPFPTPAECDQGWGHYINGLSTWFFPAVKNHVDFTSVNALLIIGNQHGSFGQATQTEPNSLLGYGQFPVNEHENIAWMHDGIVEHLRNLSVAIVWEGSFFANPTYRDPVTQTIDSEYIVMHEVGHWLGVPDLYASYAFPYPRAVANRWSLMADWNEQFLTPHELGWWRTRLDLNRTGHSPLDIPNQTGISRVELNPALAPPSNFYPTEPNAYQVRIPINDGSPFVGYHLEARKRTVTGGNLSYFTQDRVFREGVLVTYVNEGLEQPELRASVILNPAFPQDPQNAALAPGEHYFDGANGVRIDVLSVLPSNGWRVQVTRAPPGQMKADPSIRHWGNEDGTRYTTRDIWIDSPANEFGTYESTYTDGSPKGNGDAPLPEVQNRVHFRVHNDGLLNAQNVQAEVFVSIPIGAGEQPTRWTLVGTALFASIAAQDSEVGFVPWIPPANHGGHGCIKVVISPTGNELSTENNVAQENISHFDSTRNSPFSAHRRTMEVWNSRTKHARVMMVVKNLPAGWAFELEPRTFSLLPEGSQEVHVAFHPSGSSGQNPYAEEGQFHATTVEAQVWYADEVGEITGGVDFLTRLTFGTSLKIDKILPEGAGYVVKGCLSPVLTGRLIAITAMGTGQNFAHSTGTTSGSGCFSIPLQLGADLWKVQAHYAGSTTHARASSKKVGLTVP